MLSFSQLKKMYHASPLWVQRLYASIPFDWRAGRIYRETRELIRTTEELSEELLFARQADMLRDMLTHCREQVPFYSSWMKKHGVNTDSDDIRTELEKLPLIAKSDIAENIDAFRAQNNGNEPVYKDNTGGSSGTPMAFYKNNSMYPKELAYMMAQWDRVGYSPRHCKITLRGRTFSGADSDRRWMFNPIYNEIALSTYHLDADTLAASMKQARKLSPRFVHGYPSAIVTFLKVLLESGLELPQGIQAVFCGSEPLYAYQRNFISETLGCRCYSWYGQSECVILAGECECGEQYHSFPLYGLMELVDDEGQVIREPDVEGEIIGTSLHNTAMPFVRYRTGDRGIISGKPCECGRHYRRLKTVTGRTQYYIYTADMTPVPTTAFVFGQHFSAFERLRGMQLVQDEPGKLLVRLIRGDNFTEADETEIREKMHSSVDDKLSVRFEYCEELPANKAGKVAFVIQNVKSEPESAT